MSQSSALAPKFDGSKWQIPGVGNFRHRSEWTFNGEILPDGLRKSTWTIKGGPKALFDHKYEESNVYHYDSFLNLVVPGGQKQGPIRCAEVSSTVSDILYASVEVRAIFSQTPGTCVGIFFYQSDTQETDIEYLSDPASLSNQGSKIPPIHYTNQSNQENGQSTTETGPAPEDVTASHLYRIDWLQDKCVFYIDGVRQSTLTKDVPSKPCSFILNNWSNGDPGWTVGPPAQDNIFKVLSVVMHYDRAGDQ